jgi:hypothetical protein
LGGVALGQFPVRVRSGNPILYEPTSFGVHYVLFLALLASVPQPAYRLYRTVVSAYESLSLPSGNEWAYSALAKGATILHCGMGAGYQPLPV